MVNTLKSFQDEDIQTKEMQNKKPKQQALHVLNNEKGFTLLEMLVVVGIIAVIGGAMISSFGGQEAKAGRGVATQTIAGVESAMRINVAIEGVLPNNLESLVCLDSALAAHPTGAAIIDGPPPSPFAAGQASEFGGLSDLPGVGGGMGATVAGKFNLREIPTGMGTALIQAGITSLRYAEGESCDTDPLTPVALKGPVGAPFPQAPLAAIDIPNHAFEEPRPGTLGQRNRGRGFARTVNFAGATTPPLLVWSRGAVNGYDNVKVGGAADDVLIGLGLGNASDAVGDEGAPFAKAPFYGGQLARDKYSHYILLVKVGRDIDGDLTTVLPADHFPASVATLVAVLDPRGDFLDEEMAEFTGQKS